YTLSYREVDDQTYQYGRTFTYGGKLAENITQAVARDILADAMIRVATSPPLAIRLGLGARATATALSWDKELDRLVESYQSIIALPGTPLQAVA
ncbi:MAG: hypothetical protein V4503_06950, partial [Gemmatimonadota bacterium]